MKILYVVGAYGPHYAANEIHRELVLEWSRRGHECIVFAGVTPEELHGEAVSYRDGPVEVRRALCELRGRHRVVGEIGRRVLHYPRFLPLVWELGRLLDQHPDIDVIHADAVYPIGAIVVLAAVGHRAAIVPSIHGGDLIAYPGYGYGRFPLARRLIRRTFDRSAMVRVNSQLMAERARELGCDADKLHQILVNIGDRFFDDEPALAVRRASARAEVCARHQIDPAAPLLLGTGRLLPLKGFGDLIAATAIVARTRPDVRLLIAGPNSIERRLGDQRAALRQAIAEHGVEQQVILRDGLAYEREMPLYLAAADLLVAAAHIEGLNRVVAEAGTQGTPSIVSTMTGVAPLVQAMQAGSVVEARNVPALAGAVEHLLGSPALRDQYAGNARRLAQHFRSAVIAEALLDLYALARDRGASGKRQPAAATRATSIIPAL